MHSLTLPSLAVALTVAWAPSIAASKPATSVPLSGEEIANIFNGKTWDWGDSHGYFGGGGEFQAAWKSRLSADGKWYATTAGRICVEADWSPDEALDAFDRCWSHVKDDTGQIWQASSDDPRSWSKFNPRSELERGNTARASYDWAKIERTPVTAKRATNDKVAETFAQKTWKWDDGYAYFGPQGAFKAVSGKDSIGEGKWYTSGSGELCYDVTWMRANSPDQITSECWKHLIDEKDRMWQTSTSDPDGWYLFNPSSNLGAGEPYARDFARIQDSLTRIQ